MAYNFTAYWVKGSLNEAPDSLSHYPVSDPQTRTCSRQQCGSIHSGEQESFCLQDLCKYSEEDHVYPELSPDQRGQLPDVCKALESAIPGRWSDRAWLQAVHSHRRFLHRHVPITPFTVSCRRPSPSSRPSTSTTPVNSSSYLSQTAH